MSTNDITGRHTGRINCAEHGGTESRLVAAFISGLRGPPGKHVRLQMPDMVDRALNMAVTATRAEMTENNEPRDNGEDRRTVFTVRGHRQEAGGNYEGPRHRHKSQWGSKRGRNSGGRRTRFEAPRNKGYRTDCQSAVSRVGPDQGTGRREQASGPKDGDGRRLCAPASSVMIVGNVDITDGAVGKGGRDALGVSREREGTEKRTGRRRGPRRRTV
jgi:hypothetical protein